MHNQSWLKLANKKHLFNEAEEFCVAFRLPRLSLADFFFFFLFPPTAEPGLRLEFYLHENKLKDSFSYQ